MDFDEFKKRNNLQKSKIKELDRLRIHLSNQVAVLSSQRLSSLFKDREKKINDFEKIIYYSKNIFTDKFDLTNKEVSFSLNDLDFKLRKYLNYENGFFIEIGANDGVSQSNTLYYEINKGWKGVLVEPNFNNYLFLKYLRSTKNMFYNRACVSNDFKEDYIELFYNDLMTSINDANNIDYNYETFICKTSTLEKILDNSSSPNLIDLFSLDVEGYELEVLKGNNFDKYNFKYLCIESKDLDPIKIFLEEKEYELIEKLSHHDFLFKYKKF